MTDSEPRVAAVGVDGDMALSADNLLGAIEGPLGARGRCLDRLAIENTAARARFPSGALAIDH